MTTFLTTNHSKKFDNHIETHSKSNKISHSLQNSYSEIGQMKPRAVLRQHSNSYPFDERNIDLSERVKVGRAVAKCKPQDDNAIFDCKVLSRNHAMIWFENGKFFIKDTSSSNGTFINTLRLSAANEPSLEEEIHSNDIIQFGVEVVDNNTNVTHSCIIIRIKLFYPNGSEASNETNMFNIPTVNMLPPYYSYSQMIEREKLVYEKLNTIEAILEEAHLLADMTLNARKQNERLANQLNELQVISDEKTKLAEKLSDECNCLKETIDRLSQDSQNDNKRISELNETIKDRDLLAEQLQIRVKDMARQDNRLLIALFIMFITLLVVAGSDTFGKILEYASF